MPNTFLDFYRQNVDDERDDYTVIRKVLAPIAEQNPAIFDEYPDFATEYRAIREANAPSLGGEVVRGLKRGGLGTASVALGGLSLIAESPFTRDGWLKAQAKKLEEAAGAPELQATVRTMEDVAPGEQDLSSRILSRDALRYAAGKFGEAAPSIATSVGTGLVGGAIGAAGKVGAAARAAGALKGGATAAALSSYIQNAGDVYSEIPDDPALAAGLGIISAIPDTILPTLVVRRLFPGVGAQAAREAAKKLVANKALELTKKIGLGAGAVGGEGVTEYFQEAVNVVARNISDGVDPLTFGEDDYRRFREAGVTGLAGGALASPLLAMGPRRAPEEGTDEGKRSAAPAGKIWATRQIGGGGIVTSTDYETVREYAAKRPSEWTAPELEDEATAKVDEKRSATPANRIIDVDAGAVPPLTPRTTSQITQAVNQMDDATAAARLAELLQKTQRLPEEEVELELLRARAPETPAAAATAPQTTQTVATVSPDDRARSFWDGGTGNARRGWLGEDIPGIGRLSWDSLTEPQKETVKIALGIVKPAPFTDVPPPAAQPVSRLTLDETYAQPVENVLAQPPPLALSETYAQPVEPVLARPPPLALDETWISTPTPDALPIQIAAEISLRNQPEAGTGVRGQDAIVPQAAGTSVEEVAPAAQEPVPAVVLPPAAAPLAPTPTETERTTPFAAAGVAGDERSRVNEKQNRVIAIAERRGLDLDTPISETQDGAPTVRQLQQNLYPNYEASLDAFLAEFDSETPSVTHTMPDGSVMAGPEHPGAVPGTTKPMNMAGQTRPERVPTPPAPQFAKLHPKAQDRFNAAWDAKDTKLMAEYLDPQNPGLRAEWQKRTGTKLPKGIGATAKAVADYFGATTEKPPPPVSPKQAAPIVAATPDIPKPSETAPVVPSVAPTPAEQASVKAVEAAVVQPAKPLPYGAIEPPPRTIDMRGWASVKPATFAEKVRYHLDNTVRGDKSGAKGKTKVAILLRGPGNEAILAGVTVPQKLLRFDGGHDRDPIALQRMATGARKRTLKVGGKEPAVLREVLALGYVPQAFLSFDGEPTTIFEQWATMDEALAALNLTPKNEAQIRDTRKLRPEVRQAMRSEAALVKEFNELSALYQTASAADKPAIEIRMLQLQAEIDEAEGKGQTQSGDRQIDPARGDSSRGPVDPTSPSTIQFTDADLSSYTAAERQAIADLSVTFRVGFTPVEPAQGGEGGAVSGLGIDPTARGTTMAPPGNQARAQNLRRAFEQVFGKRILFVRPTTPFRDDAFSFPDLPALTVINSQSKRPLLSLIGHEWAHNLKNERPNLYKTLSDLIDQWAPMPEEYAKSRLTRYKPDKLHEEYISDIVGDRFGEPAFWNELKFVAQERGLLDKFMQLLTHAREWLTKTASKIASLPLSPWTKGTAIAEIDRIRNAVAAAVVASTQPRGTDVAFQTAAVPTTDPSRMAIDATRTQEFMAVVDRLRRQGADVQLFTQEFFRLGVRTEVEAQIADLQRRLAQATGGARAALEREIARRTERLAEIGQARGATYSPWNIALALDDVQNATTTNLVTLLHEAAEALAQRLSTVMRGKVIRAVEGALEDVRAKRDEAATRTGVAPAAESGPIDLLSEALAQRLTAEGIPDAPGLARAIWQWVKDLYYRAATAVQRAFGAEPSDELALDWFENQLRRVVGGDYDYRIARIMDRYLPEQMADRVQRYAGRGGTPGGVADFWNPYGGGFQQPSVLPNTLEAVGWNVEFQTAGLAIPNPQARARQNAAAIRGFVARLETVRTAGNSDVPWAEWWQTVGGTSGDDPKVMLAALEQGDPSLSTAAIGGEQMTAYMNGLAAEQARELMENFEAKAALRAAEAEEQIEAASDNQVLASKEVNRLEADRRNAELHEGILQEKLKDLLTRFVKDNSAGYKLAEQQGELSEAVRRAENLLERDPIPEEYQQVFKAVLDGEMPVFEYIRAIAELDLPLADLTQREMIKAIRDNADANPILKRLTQNRPLMVALAVLALRNSGQIDEIALGWLMNAEEYRAIHEELQTIRRATDEQLRQMIANAEERVKAVGLRERIKAEYLKRRRDLRTARDRVARAQKRVEMINAARAAIAIEVEKAQQTGSTAPSEWTPDDGAEFIEMVPPTDETPTWTRRKRVLRFRPDGGVLEPDVFERAIGQNKAWLAANEAKKGGASYERLLRQNNEMAMLDIRGKYAAAQGRAMDVFLAPLMTEARNLGGLGPQIAQQLAFFEHIRFVHKQTVITNAHKWSDAWKAVQKATGIRDNGLLQQQVYDPVSYYLNTEPGLDEEAALRTAIRMARARLRKPPSENFNAALERLLRTSKTGFEYLVKVAEDSGAFVVDNRLKSNLRRAVAQGWLTSMRSVDGGLVMRITKDMVKAGWKQAIRRDKDGRRVVGVKGVTFADLTAEDAANTEALGAMLGQLFTPGIVRDWLVPFVNKGGVEVFKGPKKGEVVPQIVLQNAWADAQGDVLAWIDAVGAEVGLPDAEESETDEEGKAQATPEAAWRLSMLRQLDALFAMESKIAYESNEVRNLFDPLGPKPHVMMDARLNDTIPAEHLDFAQLDPVTSQMLLAHIAFHGAFGRNGERMVKLLDSMERKARDAAVVYEGLKGTTKNARVGEALMLGYRDYDALEKAAARADDIAHFRDKLEAFMGVGRAGGPFDGTSRVWMTFLNFITGQIVDNPKTAFYNILNLAQPVVAQRSLGPETIRTVTDAFVTTAKTGLGSLLEAMHLYLMTASAEELAITQTLNESRNLPMSVATADIGPGGRQGWREALIRPLNVIRYVQNKGVGLPFQGAAKQFPRMAVIPGLGVSNGVAQIAAVGGMAAQSRQLSRLIARGAQYFATHREAAADPSFRFKARDLGYGRWDAGVFDWWRVKSVEYGLGMLEDMVRAQMPAMARGEHVVSRDQTLKAAQAVGTELNGDSSVNTMPSLLVTNPFLRGVFPLLRWPFWAAHKTFENMGTVEGRRDFRTYARGLALLAAWNLPIGLAFTFLLDEYDDKMLGKKSNLPGVGGTAALPIVGPLAEMIASDRSIPDTLKAYVVRGARAGNLGGIAADFIGQWAAPTDAMSGRRVFSLDQRVLVMSQLLNLQQATSNVINQDWTATWGSFWHPLFRSLGGNAALHIIDGTNNLLGLDNAESRQVMRVNAGNWLRAAASELDISLRPGGSGTPTPMSVWTREMLTSAMANDRIGFMEAHRKALEAARKAVASDPTIGILDREREAESRVLAGWRGRDPLTIFARKPTELEVRRMLGIMDPNGAQDVRDALNRYQQFTRLIAVSPLEQRMRAMERRLVRPPTLSNPYRRQMGAMAPVY